MDIRTVGNAAVAVGGAGLASVIAEPTVNVDTWLQAGALFVGAAGICLKALELWLKYRANKKTR